MIQIRFYHERHHDDPDPSPDLYVPYLICEQCNKPVKDMKFALIGWVIPEDKPMDDPRGYDAVVLHKGYCDKTYEAWRKERDPQFFLYWDEADRVLLQLNYRLFEGVDLPSQLEHYWGAGF